MNQEQILAIKSLDNTLLIAGAGSGKTYTIIKKIDFLINNNIYKENEILVISFTNESVNDLKKKINYNVDIKTFHKLGLDIIKNKDTKICNDYYLNYIIDEYFNSYGKYNIKSKKSIKRLLKENTLKNLKILIITFINLYKSNYDNILKLKELYNKSHFIYKDYFRIILEIYVIYNNELISSGMVSFNDMLIQSTKYIQNNLIKTNYKYIIIDEFQDTSLVRFKLIEAILKQNNGKLFAVGDDYQSIYRFSGCTLDLFLNLDKYISNLKIIKLKINYRNNQTLINIANNFIIKNKKQIKKNTICLKDNNKPIKIIFYNNKNIIHKVISNINTNILILGRNNKDKEDFNIIENNKVKYLTIHKSKGLESDNVILINLENSTYSLPSKIKNNNILNTIITKNTYPYEEERRLFYVALTRTKNNIYLLIPKNNYSIFIKELIKDNKNSIEFINL